MENKTLFTKIADREIPAEFVYEDEQCFAIRDINPKAAVHVLVIPRKPIISLAHCVEEDKKLLGHMLYILQIIAKQENLGEHFMTRIHTGAGGGQEVFHLHIHLMGDPLKSQEH